MADEVKGREHIVRRRNAMLDVFKLFQPHWKNAFHANAWEGLLDAWLEACAGVDTDLLVSGARAILKTAPNYPPKGWDLAKAARKLQYESNPHSERTGESVVKREWYWRDPVSHRHAFVQMRTDAWTHNGVGEVEKFREMDDLQRAAYCEAMENEFGYKAPAQAAV